MSQITEGSNAVPPANRKMLDNRSADAGATWLLTTLPSGYWNSVASSADGTNLVAAAGVLWDAAGNYAGGAIYHSSDAGATWVRTSAALGYWFAVASSGDGTTLFALGSSGWDSDMVPQILSTNSGVSWAPANVPTGSWNGVAVSADGAKLVVGGNGQIVTLRSPVPGPPTPPSPKLAIDRSSGNLGLSWLFPSTHFVLQQSLDLSSADWAAVLTPPTLNLTNLHYQLTLPPTLGNAFYRLKEQ